MGTGNTCSSVRKKRKCPFCQGTAIQVLSEDIEGQTEIFDQTQTQETHKAKGDTKEKRCRTEPVNLNRIKKMKPIDTGEAKHETVEFTKKVKFTVSPRLRPKFRLVTKTCVQCGKSGQVNPAIEGRTEWRCLNCTRTHRQ